WPTDILRLREVWLAVGRGDAYLVRAGQEQGDAEAPFPVGENVNGRYLIAVGPAWATGVRQGQILVQVDPPAFPVRVTAASELKEYSCPAKEAVPGRRDVHVGAYDRFAGVGVGDRPLQQPCLRNHAGDLRFLGLWRRHIDRLDGIARVPNLQADPLALADAVQGEPAAGIGGHRF